MSIKCKLRISLHLLQAILIPILMHSRVAAAQDRSSSVEQMSAWTYETIVSRMNDKKRFIASSGTRMSALAIKCDYTGQNTIYVGVYTKVFIGIGDEKRFIEYRVDGEPAKGQLWDFDKDSGNQFEKEKVAEFIKYIEKGRMLLLRVPKYDHSAFDVEVDLTGLDQVLIRIRKDCAG